MNCLFRSTYEDSSALDVHDPNFDSEEETGQENIPKLSGLHRKDTDILKPKVSISAYKKKAEAIIAEFFTSGDFGDVVDSIQELDASRYAFEFVKRLLSMSMDKDDRERESVSRLLSDLRESLQIFIVLSICSLCFLNNILQIPIFYPVT